MPSDLISQETLTQLGQVASASELTARQRNVLYIALKDLLANPNDAAAQSAAQKVILAVEKQLE